MKANQAVEAARVPVAPPAASAAAAPPTKVEPARGKTEPAAIDSPPVTEVKLEVEPAPLRPLAERTALPTEPESPTAPTAAAAPRAVTAVQAQAPSIAPVVPAQTSTAKAADGAPGVDPAPLDAASSDTGVSAGSAAAPVSAASPAPAGTTAPQISHAAIGAMSQIAAQVIRRLEGRSTRFEMALTPDDLGRVDVKLDIDSDGRLTARLAFDNPLAATDLRGRADELRRQLEQAGFQLADNALDFAERDSSSSAFDRGRDGRQGQGRAFASASRLNAETDIATQPPRWMALSLSPSGVDLKV
jgi:flagellar hook-length control protein FliK